MDLWLQFGILGLGGGAVIALIALGLVVTYRGSGVVNFAHGVFGAFGAFLFFELREEQGVPLLLSIVAGVAASAVLAAGVYLVVIRPLRDASNLMKVIATLAVLVALQSALFVRKVPYLLAFIALAGLVYLVVFRWLLRRAHRRVRSLAFLAYAVALAVAPFLVKREGYSSFPRSVQPFLPHDAVRVLGVNVIEDRFYILGITVALGTALWVVYRYSKFGLATNASAEKPVAAASLGYSPDFIGTINWGIGGGLAGLAAILIAPIIGLDISNITFLLVPALAAALLGGMSSFPLVVVAGVIMGVAQSEAQIKIHAPGWPAALPFLVIIGAMMIRGNLLPARGGASERLPRIGPGTVRKATVAFWTIVPAFLIWFVFNLKWVDATTLTLVTTVVVLSVVFVAGYAGQLSLAQFALAGIGAFIAGRLSSELGLSLIVVLPLVALALIPIGVIVGTPALRSRGVNLAIVTLGLAFAIQAVLFENNDYVDQPEGGLHIGIPKLLGWNLDTVNKPERYATVVLVVVVLLMIGVANVRRGRVGRRLISVRANERGAASLGVSVWRTKLYAFGIASAIAGVGGALFAYRAPRIQFDPQFFAVESINVVQFATLGGLGWVAGAPTGGSMKPAALGTRIFDFLGNNTGIWIALFGAFALIFIIQHRPDGIAPHKEQIGDLIRSVVRRVFRRAAPAPRPEQVATEPLRPATQPVRLEVRGLSVAFGGVRAVQDLDLDVRPGEVVGLIGPNGAGKTTVIDAITGFVTTTGGSIRVEGTEISGWSVDRRARLGVGRSFQGLELFEDMSIRDNIRTACERVTMRRYVTDFVVPGDSPISAAAYEVLREFGLEGDLDRLPGELSFGRRRLVAVARALAAEPAVLFLDEPAAGLDPVNSAEIGRAIRHAVDRFGIGIVLVEHSVDLVMSVCDRIVVLESGMLLSQGVPSEVRHDPAVVRAYLGDPIEAVTSGVPS